MGEWNIYDSSSQVKATVKRLEYNGEFMGERSITATIYSPSPINLSVGDYLTYRNEVFSIDYDPSILKQARNNTYGQGYVYDSVKFNSRQMELVYCKFLDYVIADNQVHYSSLPNFSFYCETITNLTERIQANLNRLYTGGKAWTITVNTQNVHVGRINIDVQGMTCWDALGLISEKFESTFVIRGRNIVVAPSTDILTGLFQYGKGNGLRSIARTSDPSQGVVTRLRAMGNTTNMPYNYYRNKDMYVYAPITEVLGPYETSADIHTTFDFNNCFTVNTSDNQYRTKVSLDKTNWAPAIFSANAAWVGYSVASVMQLPGYDPTQYAAFMQQLNTGTYTKLYFESGISKDKWPSQYKEYTGTLGVTTGEDRLMLPTYPDVTQDPYIDSANITKYGVREESVIFDGSNGLDDIFPTIQGMTAEQARAAGATINLDSGDNGHLDEIVSATQIDDDGIPPVEGEESEMVETFSITLKDIGFNINDYFATDNAVISMRDGKCEGREFEITECVKSGNKYVLTCKRELDDSLNRYFPYDDYNLTAGDKFVLLQIEMPELYVDAAAQRLEDAAEAYLATIDHSIYTIEPKIDNIKAKRHDDEVDSSGEGVKVYDTIYEGMLMQIEDEDLDIDDAIFIDRLTIKEGESLIPQYEVVLRNEKVKSSIQQIQQQITDIKSGVAGVSGGGTVDANQVNQLIKNYGDNRFLRKDIIDKLKQGVQVGDRFTSGLLGEGGIFRMNGDKSYLEADTLYIRMKAYFDTVEFRRFINSGGNRIASPAGGKCVRVEVINDNIGIIADSNNYSYSNGNITAPSSASYSNGNITLPSSDTHAERTGVYRCYFRATDGDGNEVHNEFQVGDQAFCHISNIRQGSLTMHHFWRLVVGRNDEGVLTENDEYWIDLSMDDCEEGSDAPVEQDSISALGHRTDTTRQGAIIEYVTGNDSPSYQIYQGINSYSLADKNYLSLGYSSVTNRAYMNVYGDFFFGNKEQEDGAYTGSYLRYDAGTKQLDIRATINAYSTIDGQSLENYIKGHQNNWTDEQIENLIFGSTEYTSMEEAIADIQSQVDGAIETWYFDADPPTLSNAPAVDWTTDDLKDQHIGDLYYSGQGNAYRFVYNDQNDTYSWVQLSDDAIAEALRIARDAKDTADGKRKVFVRQPNRNDSYDEGDLWVNATYPSGNIVKDADNDRYYLDLLRVKDNVHKASGTSFDIGHWELATNYIDKSYVDDWVTNTYAPFVRSIQGQVDGKAETWYQATDPSANWDATQKQEHIGDIWHNSSGSTINGVEAGQDAIWDGTSWKISTVPHEVFDIMDGKAQIFVSIPNVVQPDGFCYRKNDCWILEASYTLYNGVTYKQGELVTAMTDSTVYNPNHWKKSVRYTDDEKLNSLINQILNGTGASGDVATVGNALNALSQALRKDNATTTEGALLLTTLIGMRDANHTIWGGISGAYNSTLRGSGIAAWYGGAMVDIEALTGNDKNVYDAMTPAQKAASSAYAKSVDRFDGSGYRASGNISWDAQGSLTIQNIHTLYGDDGSDLLQGYTKITSMFDNSQWVSEVRIQPLQAFDHINLVRGTGNPRYDIGNYSVLNYGEIKSRFLQSDLFFALFDVYNGSTPYTDTFKTSGLPSDTSNISIKAKFGFWTERFISALGLNSSGGGGGGATTINQLDDVDTSGATVGQVLTYTQVGNTYKWTPTTVSGGGGGLDPTAMWAALATSGNQQIDASHLSDALGSYLPLTGGTLSGGLTTRTINPASNNSYSLGSNESRWKWIYTGDIYSTYFSFHSGGYLQEESSELMWHEGNGSYTVIHSGNINDYVSTTDTKVTQTATATSSAYEILFSATADNTTRTEGARKTSTLTYNPSTKALVTGGTVNGYTLAAASAKAVVTSIDTSASLPTSNAVKTFVEGKGYATQTWVNNKGYAYSSDLDDYVLKAGDSMTGHLYLDGAQASSSTGNTSQLIFRASGTEQVAISSNTNAIIINPTSDTTTGQWVIGVNGHNTYSTGSGNFGIGTSSPGYKLHVAGSLGVSSTASFMSTIYIRKSDSQGVSLSHASTDYPNRLFTIAQRDTSNTWVRNLVIFGTDGYIKLGNSQPSQKLDVDGNILASGEVTALSDIRHKSQISNVNTRIEDAADLPIFYFKWKAGHDDNMHIGTSAQAVQKLFPELVLGGEELSVNYGVLGTTLGILNSRKLTEHEREIMALKKENKALRREINKLKGVTK